MMATPTTFRSICLGAWLSPCNAIKWDKKSAAANMRTATPSPRRRAYRQPSDPCLIGPIPTFDNHPNREPYAERWVRIVDRRKRMYSINSLTIPLWNKEIQFPAHQHAFNIRRAVCLILSFSCIPSSIFLALPPPLHVWFTFCSRAFSEYGGGAIWESERLYRTWLGWAWCTRWAAVFVR